MLLMHRLRRRKILENDKACFKAVYFEYWLNLLKIGVCLVSCSLSNSFFFQIQLVLLRSKMVLNYNLDFHEIEVHLQLTI